MNEDPRFDECEWADTVFGAPRVREVFGLARALGLDPAAAEDCAIQVLEKIWELGCRHRCRRYLEARYLRAALRNAEKNRRRGHRRRRQEAGLVVRHPDIQPASAVQELREAVLSQASGLPELQKRVLMLSLAGLQPREIAGLVERSADSVRNALLHARRKIREALS